MTSSIHSLWFDGLVTASVVLVPSIVVNSPSHQLAIARRLSRHETADRVTTYTDGRPRSELMDAASALTKLHRLGIERTLCGYPKGFDTEPLQCRCYLIYVVRTPCPRVLTLCKLVQLTPWPRRPFSCLKALWRKIFASMWGRSLSQFCRVLPGVFGRSEPQRLVVWGSSARCVSPPSRFPSW